MGEAVQDSALLLRLYFNRTGGDRTGDCTLDRGGDCTKERDDGREGLDFLEPAGDF